MGVEEWWRWLRWCARGVNGWLVGVGYECVCVYVRAFGVCVEGRGRRVVLSARLSRLRNDLDLLLKKSEDQPDLCSSNLATQNGIFVSSTSSISTHSQCGWKAGRRRGRGQGGSAPLAPCLSMACSKHTIEDPESQSLTHCVGVGRPSLLASQWSCPNSPQQLRDRARLFVTIWNGKVARARINLGTTRI